MLPTSTDGQVLIAKLFSVLGQIEAVERAIAVIGVETYANGKTSYFSFSKGDQKLLDRALKDMCE